MDAKRFAEACYREKELSLKLYFEEESSLYYAFGVGWRS